MQNENKFTKKTDLHNMKQFRINYFLHTIEILKGIQNICLDVKRQANNLTTHFCRIAHNHV